MEALATGGCHRGAYEEHIQLRKRAYLVEPGASEVGYRDSTGSCRGLFHDYKFLPYLPNL